MPALAYPETAAERSRWVVAQRGARNAVDPAKPYAFFIERERSASGEIDDVATVFLTNRECPWKCLMCDLWRNTTEQSIPTGAIAQQLRFALDRLPPAKTLKLYNSGSFFDRAAIAREEHPALAELSGAFHHLIVECHPKLIGPEVVEFRDRLSGTFEVALGLETVNPEALEKINKRISVADFQNAAAFLKRHGIAVRVFLLVHPPFVAGPEQKCWLQRSIETAFDAGADVISLIPTRGGNGALDALARAGLFREPTLKEFEKAVEHAVQQGRGRVFGDTWDMERFSTCSACVRGRIERLNQMNLAQQILPPIDCPACNDDE